MSSPSNGTAETAREHTHWLVKSEPSVYAIDDLAADKATPWDGVRNYQARNFMRDRMREGDPVLFYHSSTSPPGVAGLARVCRAAYPDPTSWDEASAYHDPASSKEEPRWFMVDIEFVEAFDALVPLTELKADPALSDMLLVQKGQRLSVMPVAPEHFERVVAKARS